MRALRPGLLLLLVLVPVSAAALDEAALRAFLEQERSARELPGLRAAVAFSDGRLLRAATGMADRERSIPLDNDIAMPGGSTGKTFAAVLALLLVEDGVLSLDDPIGKWLGDRDWFQKLPNRERIRVRHLLSHSAGLGDYPGRVRFIVRMIYRVLRQGSAYFTPEELIVLSAGRGRFRPGQGFAYTDTGYLVLGRLLEAAAGEDYYTLLQRRILAPLALDQIRPQDATVLNDIAVGYQGGAANLRDDGTMKIDPRTEWAGGGLLTTPTMLARFYQALAGGAALRPESFGRMLDGGWRDPEIPGYHYGFGLFVDDGGAWIGHGGKWSGYRSQVRHYLPSGITVAVQTNTDDKTDLLAVIAGIAGLVNTEG